MICCNVMFAGVVTAAMVQMTTMTGLSSVASLSLGLSMSMSAGQPGVGERTARLQSQLSMIATPTETPVASKSPRRASLGTPTVLSPLIKPDAGGKSPSPRPSMKRQAALCPSPISEQPGDTQQAQQDGQVGQQDGHVTVMSF